MTEEEFNKKHEREVEKRKNVLKKSYEMYEKTKAETKEAHKDSKRKYSEGSLEDTLDLMDTMQNDIIEQYVQLGGDPKDFDEIKFSSRKKLLDRKNMLEKILENENRRLNNVRQTESNESVDNERKTERRRRRRKSEELVETEMPRKRVSSHNNNIDTEQDTVNNETVNHVCVTTNFSNQSYDVIPLPSRGECYKNKKGKIAVSYLTAYDENMIVSPNLYKDGTFLDHILSNKIIEDGVDESDLLKGDRDAIILYLRASAYGTDYPITVRDAKTGKTFETTVDLTKLRYKKFNLKGDEDGYFDFVTPMTKDVIKFKFLTDRDERRLKKIDDNEKLETRKRRIKALSNEILEMLNENGEDIDSDLNEELSDIMSDLNEICDEIKGGKNEFLHTITNQMIESIVSVNGDTDKESIKEYILSLNARDSSAFRKYVNENTPGIDFNITVNRPESLGGGSIDTFLSINELLFLHQSE